jgi:bifunctional non-homologous end joining protein LigD
VQVQYLSIQRRRESKPWFQVAGPFPASSSTARLPTAFVARSVHWVRPELVAEVRFANWITEGLLRQLSFRVVPGQAVEDVVREEPLATTTWSSASPGVSDRTK